MPITPQPVLPPPDNNDPIDISKPNWPIATETTSRRLRNNAVEHPNHQQPSISRPISTNTVATVQHAPIPLPSAPSLLGANGYQEPPYSDTVPASPTRSLSTSPVRPDAPLLGGVPAELTVPSPTRARRSVNLGPFSPISIHRSQTTSPFTGSEPDLHHHYASFPDPPRSAGYASAQRAASPPKFGTTARSTSYSRPDRHKTTDANQDSDDDAAPPDFRRRSSSTQQQARSRRSVPIFAPPTASPARPRSLAQSQAPPPTSILAHFAIYSYLVFFSILGTLVRLGLQWLTFYPGAPVITSTLWANFAGSFFVGFLSEDKALFRHGDSDRHSRYSTLEPKAEHIRPPSPSKIKKTMPLYIGLVTGFCGSLTSFSSFERDVFLALSNRLPSSHYHPPPPMGPPDLMSTIPRNGGYSFMALAAVIITEIGLSIVALSIGAHLALAMRDHLPSLSTKLTRRSLDTIILILGPGVWIGAILLAIFPPDRSNNMTNSETWRGTVLFSLVFAPAGCILRHVVSRKLNHLSPSFPLGTFSVNVFGCAVLAMCYNLQHVTLAGLAVGGGRTGCQVLQGIQDGFCGCLTTVSTFVLELTALAKATPRTRHSRRGIKSAWVYGFASVVSGACVMIIVMGSVLWTVGWSSPACATMRTSL